MQKLIQRNVLNLLQTRFGAVLVVVGFIYLLHSALTLLHLLTTPSTSPLCPHCSVHDYADNLGACGGTMGCGPYDRDFLAHNQASLERRMWAGTEGLSRTLKQPSAADELAPLATLLHAADGISQPLTTYESSLCHDPIDVVYTWVNGSDPKLLADLAYWKAKEMGEGGAEVEELAKAAATWAANATTPSTASSESDPSTSSSSTDSADADGDSSATANRYRDNQELRYSLRSLWKFAPWIRKVFLVTNGQVPNWLNLEHPRIEVISHHDIFPNSSHLPTFSSPAIEAHLHRIPGLARRFIYFNDDVLLGAPVFPDDFLTKSGGQKVFLSWAVPTCAPGCPDSWLGDGYCDAACNKLECQWDAGDCANVTRGAGGGDSRYGSWASSHGGLGGGGGSAYSSTPFSSSLRYCATGCPNNWIGDKVCDRACKNVECAFDGGDCGVELMREQLIGIQLQTDEIVQQTDPSTLEDGLSPLRNFPVPSSTASLYVNLSNIFPGSSSTIVDASHDAPHMVRSAVVTANLKVLTLVLYEEKDVVEMETSLGMGGHATAAASGADAHVDPEVMFSQNATSSSSSSSSSSTPSPQQLGPRRIEIFIQGEVDGVLRNVTFNITRPRAPDQIELEAAAREAEEETRSMAAGTNGDGVDAAAGAGSQGSRFVEDPEAMFAAANAAAATSNTATAPASSASTHRAQSSPNVAVPNQDAHLTAADAVASQAIDAAAGAGPQPHDYSQSAYADDDDDGWDNGDIGDYDEMMDGAQQPAAVGVEPSGARRRLLSSFDTLVSRLKHALGSGSSSTGHRAHRTVSSTQSGVGGRRSAPTTSTQRHSAPIDPNAPYKPQPGYHQPSATKSLPSFASTYSQLHPNVHIPASFHPSHLLHHSLNPASSGKSRHHVPLLVPPERWRDMPVIIEGVPLSDDMVHSGIKMREPRIHHMHAPAYNSHRTGPSHHKDNMWMHGEEEFDMNAFHDPSTSNIDSSNVVIDPSTGRILEWYGHWSHNDFALASKITAHKQKELWALERAIAQADFLRAYQRAARERRIQEQGKWEQLWKEQDEAYGMEQMVHQGGVLNHDGDIDGMAASSMSTSRPFPRRRAPPRRRLLSHEPIWPWELNVAAPELFAEWGDFVESTQRHGVDPLHQRGARGHTRHAHHHQQQEKMGTENGASGVAPRRHKRRSLFGHEEPMEKLAESSFSDVMSSASPSSSPYSTTSASPIDVDADPSHDHSSHASVSVSQSSRGPRRQLLDVYGDSLRFVHTLYTKEFGREQRKAPAHMPHLIDVAIERELQDRWPHLFDATSSHRFRSSHDMQYSFSYFYYLMNAPREFDWETVFNNQLDLDRDGTLNAREIRWMTLWLSGKKVLESDLIRVQQTLLNTSRILGHAYDNDTFNPEDPPYIDVNVVSHSGDVADLIEDKWRSLRKFRFELESLDQVEFYMVPDDTEKVVKRLDEIRVKQPKFICLNDDMNKTSDPPHATLEALRDFYISYFPNPCPFELADGVRNDFAYIEEWRARKRSGWNRFKQWLMQTFGFSSSTPPTAPAVPTKGRTYTPSYTSSATTSTSSPFLFFLFFILLSSALIYFLQRRFKMLSFVRPHINQFLRTMRATGHDRSA